MSASRAVLVVWSGICECVGGRVDRNKNVIANLLRNGKRWAVGINDEQIGTRGWDTEWDYPPLSQPS